MGRAHRLVTPRSAADPPPEHLIRHARSERHDGALYGSLAFACWMLLTWFLATVLDRLSGAPTSWGFPDDSSCSAGGDPCQTGRVARLPSLRFRGDRWVHSAFTALVGVWLLAAWANAWYVADRFAHHSEIVDATIVRTIQLGCFGARGSGAGMGSGDTVYAITFPHPGGVHATTVARPCHVIPPDFGRGRGAVWIQYDVDDLDRTRVLNDDGAEQQVARAPIFILVLFGLAAWVAPRRGRSDAPPPPPGG